ncbi:hypothetical protein [Deinococcus aquaticus]|uniref:hypothetical protein n=1 Tax=Deinococcus aquaticus TaxID=328692 RepID=UPI003F4597A4
MPSVTPDGVLIIPCQTMSGFADAPAFLGVQLGQESTRRLIHFTNLLDDFNDQNLNAQALHVRLTGPLTAHQSPPPGTAGGALFIPNWGDPERFVSPAGPFTGNLTVTAASAPEDGTHPLRDSAAQVYSEHVVFTAVLTRSGVPVRSAPMPLPDLEHIETLLSVAAAALTPQNLPF